jgi:hypothetical protein
VLQNHEGIAGTLVVDSDAGARCVSRDEQFVLRHLAKADHRPRIHAVAAEDAFALGDDQAVGDQRP